MATKACPTPLGSWTHRCIQIGNEACATHIQLIAFDPGRLQDDAFETWEIAMPPEIARSVPKRKEEFFYGRMAARYALAAEHLGCDAASAWPRPLPSPPVIGMGTHREPLWPPGVVGSITHCSGLAAATVAPMETRRGVGIDIERVAGTDAIDALMRVAIDSDELACLRTATARWPLELWITAAFSAKESFYKGVFATVGRIFEFDAVRLRFIDEERQRLGFTVMQSLAAPLPEGYVFDVDFAVPAPATVLTHFAW